MRKIASAAPLLIDAELLHQRLHGAARGFLVELHLAAEKVVGRHEAEDQICVGDGRVLGVAVAGRARIGAGALRSDAQQAERIDLRHRAAARADRSDVDHLDGDALVVFPMFGRRWDVAFFDHADIEAGAAHIDREQVLFAKILAEIDRARRRRRRTGVQQKHRAANAFGDVLHEAVRQHHQESAGETCVLEHFLERSEIVRDRRADIGANRGGVETLKLAPDRQRLVRGADEDLRCDLAHDLSGAALVLRVGVGMKEAYGNRLDALGLEFLHCVAHFLLVERCHDAAVDQRALFDADAARAGDEWPIGRDE